MAEYTNVATQTVIPNQDVRFDTTAVNGNCGIIHREGSGLVELMGRGNQCRALYDCEYSGNIALADGATVGPISLALAINGEALGSATATVTPTAVGDFFNVSVRAQVAVPRCCCFTLSVQNNGVESIDVQNSNLTVSRIA